MLVALTPRSLLAKDVDPRKEIAGLSEDRMMEMEPELARLSLAFLSAVERRGPASLELIAASCYFDRLMDNSKVVRYLAHNFSSRNFTGCRRAEFRTAAGGRAAITMNPFNRRRWAAQRWRCASISRHSAGT